MAAEITQAAIDSNYERLHREAEASGYHLNPDVEFTKELINGLLVNEQRYGYWNCPCRRATGVKAEDMDIICPCDYRDADVAGLNACYCSLYVSTKVVKGEAKALPVPERRPPKEVRDKMKEEKEQKESAKLSDLPLPVWRCQVCGYLCARDNPPDTCPICKVPKERFERFI